MDGSVPVLRTRTFTDRTIDIGASRDFQLTPPDNELNRQRATDLKLAAKHSHAFDDLNCPHNEMKLKQNSFKTVFKQF